MPLDDLTCFAIDDFGPLSRLCSGLHSPLRFDKQICAYEPPASHTDLKYGAC